MGFAGYAASTPCVAARMTVANRIPERPLVMSSTFVGGGKLERLAATLLQRASVQLGRKRYVQTGDTRNERLHSIGRGASTAFLADDDVLKRDEACRVERQVRTIPIHGFFEILGAIAHDAVCHGVDVVVPSARHIQRNEDRAFRPL